MKEVTLKSVEPRDRHNVSRAATWQGNPDDFLPLCYGFPFVTKDSFWSVEEGKDPTTGRETGKFYAELVLDAGEREDDRDTLYLVLRDMIEGTSEVTDIEQGFLNHLIDRVFFETRRKALYMRDPYYENQPW